MARSFTDFAKIVIVNEHHDLFKPTPDETKNAEKAAYDVKRAGNPLYQGDTCIYIICFT